MSRYVRKIGRFVLNSCIGCPIEKCGRKVDLERYQGQSRPLVKEILSENDLLKPVPLKYTTDFWVKRHVNSLICQTPGGDREHPWIEIK